jgi:replicative DNA helicase
MKTKNMKREKPSILSRVGTTKMKGETPPYRSYRSLAKDPVHVADALRLADKAAKTEAAPTGCQALDYHRGGLLPGSITVLAAEPFMGHHQVALSLAASVAIKYRRPTLFVSTDWPVMSAARYVANGRAAASLENVPLHFYDAFGQNFDEIAESIWSLFGSAEEEARCLVLDSLGDFFPEKREGDRGAELHYILDYLREITSVLSLTTLLIADLRSNPFAPLRRPKAQDLEYFDIVGKYADVFFLLSAPPGEGPDSDERNLEVVRDRFCGCISGTRVSLSELSRGLKSRNKPSFAKDAFVKKGRKSGHSPAKGVKTI